MERDENYNSKEGHCYCGIRCKIENKEELQSALNGLVSDAFEKTFSSKNHFWLRWEECNTYDCIWFLKKTKRDFREFRGNNI